MYELSAIMADCKKSHRITSQVVAIYLHNQWIPAWLIGQFIEGVSGWRNEHVTKEKRGAKILMDDCITGISDATSFCRNYGRYIIGGPPPLKTFIWDSRIPLPVLLVSILRDRKMRLHRYFKEYNATYWHFVVRHNNWSNFCLPPEMWSKIWVGSPTKAMYLSPSPQAEKLSKHTEI